MVKLHRLIRIEQKEVHTIEETHRRIRGLRFERGVRAWRCRTEPTEGDRSDTLREGGLPQGAALEGYGVPPGRVAGGLL